MLPCAAMRDAPACFISGMGGSGVQAQEVHQAIRAWMSEKVSPEVAEVSFTLRVGKYFGVSLYESFILTRIRSSALFGLAFGCTESCKM